MRNIILEFINMNIKYILGVLVVILLISNVFCIYEMQFSNQNSNNEDVMFGNESFSLPNNFSVMSDSNRVDLTNGIDIISIFKLNDTNINSAINHYEEALAENFTVTVEEFNSDITINKTIATNNQLTVVRYWFELDNNIYVIQADKNDKMFDEIAKDISNSMS